MNSCYVLIKETNLDTFGYKNQTNPYSATKTVRVFSDFENAKQHMQNILKEYAGKKNNLFDGNGNILHLEDYLNFCLEEDELDEDEADIYCQLPQILRTYFLNEAPDGAYFLNVDPETMVAFETYAKYGIILDEDFGVRPLRNDSNYESELLHINPYNIPTPNPEYEITPVRFAINSFYMDNPEKTYVCRIEGEYENWDKPYFFYLELRKIDIE